jgi:hypothetical protein
MALSLGSAVKKTQPSIATSIASNQSTNIKGPKTMNESRQEFLSDIIVTAVEGGINYWGGVSAYQWDNGPTTATIVDWESDDEFPITVDDVNKTVNDIISGRVEFPEHLTKALRYCSRTNETCPDEGPDYVMDIDADFADCIIQVCVFGEIVYG